MLEARRSSEDTVVRHPSSRTPPASPNKMGVEIGGIARRTVGIFLLLIVVFLWTASNFLASVSGGYFLSSRTCFDHT
jgi:hypothetical protein